MNKKSLIYGLVGFLAGSTATLLLLLTAIKTFSQASKPTVVTGGNAKTSSLVGRESFPNDSSSSSKGTDNGSTRSPLDHHDDSPPGRGSGNGSTRSN
jgi:hypothetical protein